MIHPQHDFRIWVGHTADYFLAPCGLDGGVCKFVPCVSILLHVHMIISALAAHVCVLFLGSSIYLMFAAGFVYLGANVHHYNIFKRVMCALQM